MMVSDRERGPDTSLRMSRFYAPSTGPSSWQALLAEPERQWAVGYSARTLAHAWEAANGLPPEVASLVEPVWGRTDLLIGLPEHKVPLPGGRRESQSDLFTLLRTDQGLAACTIEGKVDEPFGPTLDEWLVGSSAGKRERLAFLLAQLGLSEVPGSIRYQLLHRTVSAIIEAKRFSASATGMIVHSFSPEGRWFHDFAAFLALFGVDAKRDRAVQVTALAGLPLLLGWATGDQRFRTL